ncbi:DUF222 domain-containing protein [Phytoactinopolyspora alkaliphila]|uniref:DUF222 domain-containing protein n=1 Tax=Phytoactinopolyspora alkaliphila TaxID=1783498 RepID=A0A6N9YT95_9ACTN|nr:DUF222 domain-containing protein [Phytoactinopolyspora alkaliphila]
MTELARRHLDTKDLPHRHGHSTQLLLLADLDTLTQHANSDNTADDTNDEHQNAGAHGEATCGDRDHARADTHPRTAPHGRSAARTARGGNRGRRRRWLQDTWAHRFGVAPAELAWSGPISTEAARRLSCDAAVIPIVLDTDGVPLRVGRTERTVTPGIWTALIARDRGCAFPGCTRPPAWCHAHHITHWADGGPTNLDNLTLLCGHHHRTIHHRGWDVHTGADGHPDFLPPPWVDPERTPRRNTRPRHDHQPPPRAHPE